MLTSTSIICSARPHGVALHQNGSICPALEWGLDDDFCLEKSSLRDQLVIYGKVNSSKSPEKEEAMGRGALLSALLFLLCSASL